MLRGSKSCNMVLVGERLEAGIRTFGRWSVHEAMGNSSGKIKEKSVMSKR